MQPSDCQHSAPLPFVVSQLNKLVASSGEQSVPPRVLDIGCGSGRHLCAAAELGFQIVGVDRNADILASCQSHMPDAALIEFDVEENASLPPLIAPFDVVVTTFFLFRPLVPKIAAALAPGGVWLLETFHAENRVKHGRPRREAFALADGEASHLAREAGLEVISVDEGDHAGTFTTQLAAMRR